MNRLTKLSLLVLASLLAACSNDRSDEPIAPITQEPAAETPQQPEEPAQPQTPASEETPPPAADDNTTPPLAEEAPAQEEAAETTVTDTNTEVVTESREVANTIPEATVSENTSSDAPIKGYAYTLSGENLATSSAVKNIESDSLDTVNVDGQTLTLAPSASLAPTEGISGGVLEGEGALVSSDATTYLRYGIMPNVQGGREVFAQGEPTPISDMPTNGVAYYSGSAMLLNNNTTQEGSASFEANFADKKLTGQIYQAEKDIVLAADINGNTFKGTNGGVETHGGFYGPAAAELGGVFKDSNTNTTGAYGAVVGARDGVITNYGNARDVLDGADVRPQ